MRTKSWKNEREKNVKTIQDWIEIDCFFFIFCFFRFIAIEFRIFSWKMKKKLFFSICAGQIKMQSIWLAEREDKNKTIKWVNFFSNFKRYKHLQYFTVSSCYNCYPICVYRFRLIVRSKSVFNTHNLLFVAAWPIWLILKKILSRFNIRGTHTHFFVLFQSFTT